MRHILHALLAVTVLGVASCVPLADHPAGDERNARFDARLQGAWRAVGEEEPFIVFVGPADDAGHGIDLVTVEETRDGRWKTSEYGGVTTQRGDHGFLSIRYQTTGGERRGWVIARYALLGPDRLRMQTLDETRLAALVRAGKIPGRVSDDGPYADVDLTMSSADLLAFLDSAEGERALGAAHVLVRVDLHRDTAAAAAHQSTGTGVAPTPSR